MSERKVLNKYFPPDFDPSKIERRKPSSKPKSKQLSTVRLMTPYSMRCNTCGEYIHTGKKFNARKEQSGEFYYKIEIIRFFIRCPCCSAEISFKTDPKNADYQAEHGAHRPYKSAGWRLTAAEQDEEANAEAEQEESAMSKLEAKTLESRQEMERMDALDELRSKNARVDRANTDQIMERIEKQREHEAQLRSEAEKAAEAEIDAAAQAAFRKTEDGEIVRAAEQNSAGGPLTSSAPKPSAQTLFKPGNPVKRKSDMANGIIKKKKTVV